jgi:hypothetical protein
MLQIIYSHTILKIKLLNKDNINDLKNISLYILLFVDKENIYAFFEN